MLNRAARYFPILSELNQVLPREARVLEIGSGTIGLGEFRSSTFVGCDIAFEGKPKPNMRPVICSGYELPFYDRSFDAVVASDVMEHVVPERRQDLVQETLRVTKTIAVFGYPCGPEAFESDRQLSEHYKKKNKRLPEWLKEHMLHPFPNGELFKEVPAGWQVKAIPNENLRFHSAMMKMEMHRLFDYSFRLALVAAPWAVRAILQRADSKPSYRMIYVLTRTS